MTPAAALQLARRRTIGVAAAGFCTFLNLYATQALLPVLGPAFDVPPERASSTVTAPLLAVALVAPFVGSISDMVGRRRLILGAAALLVVPTALAATATSLSGLLAWRFLQGLLLPFIFAITVAYVGEECPGADGIRLTGTYVTATVAAGFSGRFLAGVATALAGWRSAFLLLAALTAAAAALIALTLPPERRFRPIRGLRRSAAGFAAHLTDRRLLAADAAGFAVLFTIVAAFTYANLLLAARPFGLGPAALGSVFAVYLLGMVATPAASRLAVKLGRRRALAASVPVAFAGLALTLIPALVAIIAGLALIASAVFVQQAFAIGYVGATARHAKSTAVGLYVTTYYAGGSVGGILPAGIWRSAGWPGCVAVIAAVQAAMLGLVLLAWREEG
ncbi:MAG TPA: MFS transporter [Acetobacteraceae bacterium]|nr:MFS transporter [Acetobacteraceae bacterium]